VIPLNKVLQAKLKQSASSMVRVYEDYVDVKDVRTNQTKASLRVILYLEDNGVDKGKKATNLQQARDNKQGMNNSNNMAVPANQDQQVDYQTVWQLEMWKRAEEAKFKAYLKQKEIEKIEEITITWRNKESDREMTFNDALKNVETLETKLRNNALELQRREERIIQLEEELRHKINEVSRSLVNKEEETLAVKKRFKEEKH
jgi:hypothetical protein